MGLDRRAAAEAEEAFGLDGGDAVLLLHEAFDEEERRADDDEAVVVEEVGADDDVGDAGFIFEGEEDEALGGAWTLTGDDGAGDADAASVADAAEVDGAEDAAEGEVGASEGHRVGTDGEAGAVVVGGDAFEGGHGRQG